MNALTPGPDLAETPWGSRRLWSLWDMINFHLIPFNTGLQILAQETLVASAITHQHAKVAAEYRKHVTSQINYVAEQCRKMLLQGADNRLGRLYTALGNPHLTYAELTSELSTLREAIDDDLQFERFFHYRKAKGFLLLRRSGDWQPTIKAFPITEKEIDDALDCYATEHDTACVFHLMRVAEYGLRALAKERKVVMPKNKLIEWSAWQEIIREITKSAEASWGNASPGPKKGAALDFYSGAIGGFHAFKDKYRNAVMHVRSRYDEHEALQAINQVRDFMNGLSRKIGETTKGPIRQWP